MENYCANCGKYKIRRYIRRLLGKRPVCVYKCESLDMYRGNSDGRDKDYVRRRKREAKRSSKRYESRRMSSFN